MSSQEAIVSSESSEKSEQGNQERFLAFSLGKEHFGIPLIRVKEVIGLTEITSVPYTPSHFKGVMNLRGQVISVVDLRIKMNLSKTEIKPETAIVILDVPPLSIGIMVDSVDNVLSLSSVDIQETPDIENHSLKDSITGVVRQDHNLIVLIDIIQILNIQESLKG